MKAHVSESKKREVEIIKELMNKYKVVGIIDLTGMPSPQLQKMRKKLKDSLIRITKKRLIKIALEDLKEKKGIEKLEEVMRENVMPCLILTNDDSFKLAKVLRQAKSSVAAKAGQIAPRDIIIKAGPTSFVPGPIIGEFGMLGVKAAVEGGKIVVKQDKVLVKEGEEISAKVADMLGKLGIEPMQVGLNLVATFDNGIIFKKDVLDVDDKWYLDNIKLIANDGFKLAVQVGYICKETIEFLISKAEREAKALGNNKKEVKEKIEEKPIEEKKESPIEIKEKPKKEIKIEDKVETKEEIAKEKIEELKKQALEKKLSAEELVKEVVEKVEKEKIEEEKKKEEEEKNRVPTARELAEKKKEEEKKEPEKIPTAAELAEKKKEKEK